MATARDIEHDITLELDGDISPENLASAITAFTGLINGGHKQADPNAKMKWRTKVKRGSALIGYYTTPTSSPIDPVVIDRVQRGMESLEATTERPEGFTDAMMQNLKTLCSIAHEGKGKHTIVRAWFKKKPSTFSPKIKRNIESGAWQESAEYGSVEGRLEALDAHNRSSFAIYEPLRSRKIICTVKDNALFDEAYKLFKRRVMAEGLVKYNSKGLAYEICVERFFTLPEKNEIPDYRLTRGILKAYV